VFSRYLKYKDNGIVSFTTFHQSFSYEEFIEGIRPVVSPEEKAKAGGSLIGEQIELPVRGLDSEWKP
ncbi:MAG TPA: hypothetical protein PKI22_07580, partial [Hydrogenophilus thermoluteolus]|nr:hypothetical protein [Hydrogenophilus thermoluteolus]